MSDKLQYKNANYFQESCFFRVSKGLNIGIYGGSFNPPHKGHMDLCKNAIKHLKLDLLIWLVSPLNPLKAKQTGLLPIKTRIKLCEDITKHNHKVKIISVEESFNLHYSYLTLGKLKEISNNNNLVWIMGEDNLAKFHLFKQWEYVLKNFNIAVFAREEYSFASLLSKASLLYKKRQVGYFDNHIEYKDNKTLKFFLLPKNKISSTQIRKNNR